MYKMPDAITKLSHRDQAETGKQLIEPLRCRAFNCNVLFVHDPANHASNRFPQLRVAYLSHRRQFHETPFTQTSVTQFTYQKTVHQHHIRVSGLPHSITQLTVSQSLFRLPVSVKGFRARPTVTISLHELFAVLMNAIRHKVLRRLSNIPVFPNDNNSTRVLPKNWSLQSIENMREQTPVVIQLSIENNGKESVSCKRTNMFKRYCFPSRSLLRSRRSHALSSCLLVSFSVAVGKPSHASSSYSAVDRQVT